MDRCRETFRFIGLTIVALVMGLCDGAVARAGDYVRRGLSHEAKASRQPINCFRVASGQPVLWQPDAASTHGDVLDTAGGYR